MKSKNKLMETTTLAFSVGLLVSAWGTFHSYMGISLAWPAFISAALFFAMKHPPKCTLTVITGHIIGVFWGISFFRLSLFSLW